jgi:hypothetical protein
MKSDSKRADLKKSDLKIRLKKGGFGVGFKGMFHVYSLYNDLNHLLSSTRGALLNKRSRQDHNHLN